MRPLLCSLVAVCLLGTGCQWVPKSRIAALESKHQLLCEKYQAQTAELDNLRTQKQKLARELADADRELVTQEDKLENYQLERSQLKSRFASLSGARQDSPRLRELAQRYRGVVYDPQTGVGKFQHHILFQTGRAQLERQSEGDLADMAEILKSPEAQNLNVLIVGHTDDQAVVKPQTRQLYPTNWHLASARAAEVLEYFRQAGIAPERMGVSAYGPFQPIASNGSQDGRQQNRRVEVFLMEPDIPVVGRTDTLSHLY